MNRIVRGAAHAGRSVALAEVLFVALPIAVTVFILLLQGDMREVLLTPEWAFAAAVLGGQSVLRLARVRSTTPSMTIETANLGAAMLLMLYAACVAVLVTIMLKHDQGGVPVWIGALQVVLFIIALMVFVVFGALAHAKEQRTK